MSPQNAPAFLNGQSYLALPRDPQKWVLQDLIPVGGLTNIYGKPKAGKSFAALEMAQAISAGAPDWLGFPIHKHGPVAYIQIDTPRGEWAGRVADLQVRGQDVSNLYTCDMWMTPTYPFDILGPATEALNATQWLKGQLEAIKPVVVFIDTLREVHSLDENNSTDMRNVVTAIVAAARPAAIVLVSHSRKDNITTASGGDDLMSDQRGSSYVAGRMDVVVRFTTNGKHATGMVYKGRSRGQGIVKVAQDDQGFIVLDGKDAAWWNTLKSVVNTMRAADPKASVLSMAEALLEEKDIQDSSGQPFKKLRQTQSDISLFLEKGHGPTLVPAAPKEVKSAPKGKKKAA